MNYEQSYEVLDLLDKYTDMTQKVKSYDQTEERILELVEAYRNKDQGKQINDLDLSVLDSLSQEQLEKCIKIFCKASAEIAPLKKEAKTNAEILKKRIADTVLEMCKKDGNTSLTMKFDGFGTVKVSESEVFSFSAKDEEELSEIIDSLFELGFTQFLKIDEKQYLAYAEQFKQTSGNYLPGVTSRMEVTPKITARKAK